MLQWLHNPIQDSLARFSPPNLQVNDIHEVSDVCLRGSLYEVIKLSQKQTNIDLSSIFKKHNDRWEIPNSNKRNAK